MKKKGESDKNIYDILNDVDNSDIFEEFELDPNDKWSNEKEKIFNTVYERMKKEEKNKNSIGRKMLKIAAVFAVIFSGFVGINFAMGGNLLDNIASLSLPFEKQDYSTFKNYVYIPKKSIDVSGCEFSVKGLVLDGDTIHLSTLLKSNNSAKIPEYDVNLYINGKMAKNLGGYFTNPNNIEAAGNVDFSTKGFDMNEKNTYEVRITFLDSVLKNLFSHSIKFDAKLNNIEKISKIKDVNKTINLNGVVIKVGRVYINPFGAKVNIEYIVNDYNKYKKMYNESKDKVVWKDEATPAVGIHEYSKFSLNGKDLRMDRGYTDYYIKDNKYVLKTTTLYTSRTGKDDFEKLLNSTLYDNVDKAKLKLGYALYLNVNEKNKLGETVLKLLHEEVYTYSLNLADEFK